MELSKLARSLGNSTVREMYEKARTIENPVSFTLGEPDFITPEPIIEEACRNWMAGKTHYTPNRGIPELCSAISEYHKNDIAPDPNSQIMVSCGATEALQIALLTLVDPGDEVIVCTPVWPNYFGQIAMAGAICKPVPLYEENNFMPDPDDIKKAITPKTKLLMLNFPSNPTGAVLDYDSSKALADIVLNNNIFVLTDEIYSRIVFDETNTSITSFPGIMDRCVYVSGFSKMFAMTGWRLGYAISTPEIISQMAKMHENSASNLPEPSQMAAAYGLRHCDSAIGRMRDSYHERRDLICGLLNEIPGVSIRVPKGAFYAFVNVKELQKQLGMTTRELCFDLVEKIGVVIVPGTGFGEAGDGFVRITYAVSRENICEGMARFKDYAEKAFRF
jgi:hypothetical protein